MHRTHVPTRRGVYTYANTRCGTHGATYLYERVREYMCLSSVARLSKYSPTPMYTRIWDVFTGYRDFRYSRQSRKIFRHAAAADTAPDKSDEGAAESRMQKSIFYIRSIYSYYTSRACFTLFSRNHFITKYGL